MIPTNELVRFGLDLGAGAIKLYGLGQGSQLPSQVAVSGAQRVSRLHGLGQQKLPLEVTVPLGSFYVGANAHDAGMAIENLGLDRFSGSPEIQALTFGAFTRYIQQMGPLDVPLSLTVGLPLESFSGNEAQTTVEGVQRWLRGMHTWQADDQPYTIEIAEVRVTSQPVGGLFDALLNEEGHFIPARREWFNKEVGVISIGMSTMELLVVRSRAPVQRFTAGATIGVRRLLELVDGQRLYSLGELDSLLRAGRLDISQALPIWQEEVSGRIEKLWGNAWRRFAAVILLGGGAILLKNTLPYRFGGKAVLPDDPVIATARGLAKMGLMQAQKKG